MEKMYRRYSEYNCVDATTVYPITSIELLPFLEPSVLRDRFHSWEGWPLKLIYSISYPTYMIWKWIRSGYCFEPLEIMKWTIVQYWTQIPFHALSFTLSWWCEWILNKLTIPLYFRQSQHWFMQGAKFVGHLYKYHKNDVQLHTSSYFVTWYECIYWCSFCRRG